MSSTERISFLQYCRSSSVSSAGITAFLHRGGDRTYEGRRPLGRCYLEGRAGGATNVILSAVGYNLRLVLAWLRMILRVVLLALLQIFAIQPGLKPAS